MLCNMDEICNICPRKCGVDRRVSLGFCQMPDVLYAARAALHFWEEPCISGTNGSGTVFFSGCNLRCVYCQNRDIAHKNFGKEITTDKLCDIFLGLHNKNAHNINLVTPTHYAFKIKDSLLKARAKGLDIPVIYNTSGYECVETLKELADVTDIYMTDFKYWLSDTAARYSKSPDYSEVAKKALDVMVRLQPDLIFDDSGILQKGVIVRIMLLPGHVYEAKRILEYVYKKYGDSVILSLMSQYTPIDIPEGYSEINRKVRKKEYESLVSHAIDLGVKNVYIQEGDSADESFIPPFTLEGID